MALAEALKKILQANKEEIHQYLNEYDNWPQWKKDAGKQWYEQYQRDCEIMAEQNKTQGQQ